MRKKEPAPCPRASFGSPVGDSVSALSSTTSLSFHHLSNLSFIDECLIRDLIIDGIVLIDDADECGDEEGESCDGLHQHGTRTHRSSIHRAHIRKLLLERDDDAQQGFHTTIGWQIVSG